MRMKERRQAVNQTPSPNDDYESLKASLHRFVIDRIEDDNIIYDDDSKKTRRGYRGLYTPVLPYI